MQQMTLVVVVVAIVVGVSTPTCTLLNEPSNGDNSNPLIPFFKNSPFTTKNQQRTTTHLVSGTEKEKKLAPRSVGNVSSKFSNGGIITAGLIADGNRGADCFGWGRPPRPAQRTTTAPSTDYDDDDDNNDEDNTDDNSLRLAGRSRKVSNKKNAQQKKNTSNKQRQTKTSQR